MDYARANWAFSTAQHVLCPTNKYLFICQVPPLPKKDLTLAELRKYDGLQDEHILLALNGTVSVSSFYDTVKSS